MHFLEAEKILKIARDKILDEQLYARYLVELPYMDNNNYMSYEEYKQKIFELVRMQNRTKEEKEEDMKFAREKAEKAIKILDENRDFHKEQEKAQKRKEQEKRMKKQKTSKFIK